MLNTTQKNKILNILLTSDINTNSESNENSLKQVWNKIVETYTSNIQNTNIITINIEVTYNIIYKLNTLINYLQKDLEYKTPIEKILLESLQYTLQLLKQEKIKNRFYNSTQESSNPFLKQAINKHWQSSHSEVFQVFSQQLMQKMNNPLDLKQLALEEKIASYPASVQPKTAELSLKTKLEAAIGRIAAFTITGATNNPSDLKVTSEEIHADSLKKAVIARNHVEELKKKKSDETPDEPSPLYNPEIDRIPIDELVDKSKTVAENHFNISKLPSEITVFESALELQLTMDIDEAKIKNRGSFATHTNFFKFAINEIANVFASLVNLAINGKFYSDLSVFKTNRQKNLENIKEVFAKPEEENPVYKESHAVRF